MIDSARPSTNEFDTPSEPFAARVENSDVLPEAAEAAPAELTNQFTEATHQPAPAALYEAPMQVVSPEVQAAHNTAEHHRHATRISQNVETLRKQHYALAA